MAEHDTCVAAVPIFRGLSHEQQLEVASFAKPVRAEKGALLQEPGSKNSRLMVVHSGRIRLVHALANGREQLVRVVEPGDSMGEAGFLLGQRPEHFAYADGDVTLCTFEHQDLGKLVATYPGIALRMLQVSTQRLQSAERMLAAFSSTDVGTRVAAYLMDLPSSRVDGVIHVRLPMAKKDIASYLGTTPETLSRTLASFAAEGLIATSGRRDVAILDPARLSDRSMP
ncbi:MAG TPA: Crp/Fnr family transcriptional regulator [Tessaracoccus flavescens]|uniref:Crp/Fnr family transcriptional regulator n=1 Tax=Tessaracoccus flavescens TaxID=399497 RepID=A0A921EMU6_9ACTN|nr:Crp/Fnr family transcriptional regulator [Tessaracoccus flavescens]